MKSEPIKSRPTSSLNKFHSSSKNANRTSQLKDSTYTQFPDLYNPYLANIQIKQKQIPILKDNQKDDNLKSLKLQIQIQQKEIQELRCELSKNKNDMLKNNKLISKIIKKEDNAQELIYDDINKIKENHLILKLKSQYKELKDSLA